MIEFTETKETLVDFLAKQNNEYLEGFYNEDTAVNPYSFFDEYSKHYDFAIGNQSMRRVFYKENCTF